MILNERFPNFIRSHSVFNEKEEPHNIPIISDFKVSVKNVPKTNLISKIHYDLIMREFAESNGYYSPQGSLDNLTALKLFGLINKGDYSSNYLINRSLKTKSENKAFLKNTPIKKIAEYLLRRPEISSESIRSMLQRLTALAIPSKKRKQIVHSNNPWDLATMSMRGIKSCMNWESKHRGQLVGSIIDPGCSIIYITDQAETEYGSKMLFRSLVRIMRDFTVPHKNIVLVDRLYSSTGHQIESSEKKRVLEMFRSALEKNLKNDTRISSVIFEKIPYTCYLPATNQVYHLPSKYRSCVDSHVFYEVISNE